MERNIELLFEVHEKNEEWFSANREKLEQKYGSKFLAVKDQDVIATEEKIEKLLELLEKRGEDINLIFITSIPPKGVGMIL